MKRIAIAAAVLVGLVETAHAFCGFYVAGGDQKMFNDATQVVLMRKGTRTVLSMQNNYKGPPEAFAMVIPVPTVLHEGDVKTLDKDIFTHVEQMGAPRLVEYWEQDPCRPPMPPPMPSGMPMRKPRAAQAEGAAAKDLGVTIEAKFVVGEYQILILSAKDSTGLDTWLKQEKYTIPDGAEPLLRPYVEAGMKFFVAKVDPAKVKFVDGRAALSPLRFFYDTEDFSLPIRLGLANSSGTQDLIVNILAPSQRYEVANYKNVFIPTNIDVNETVKDKFGAFYAALFDRTIEKNPGAVVTEYAWQATTCDPCPGPQLGYHELITLGADVLDGSPTQDQPPAPAQARPGQPPPPGSYYRGGYGMGSDFVLTRLHARYGKDISDDLHFKAAQPVAGGREFMKAAGKLEEGAAPADQNNFQGRYAIRHEWTGPLSCANPIRHQWGGPPPELAAKATGVKPALDLAFAPRGQVALPEVVQRDVPEIGIVAAAAKVVAAPVDVAPHVPAPATPERSQHSEPKKSGCGCDTSTGDPGVIVLMLGTLLVWRRRR